MRTKIADPENITGKKIRPEEWNDFISDKEIKPSLIEKELLSFWESKKIKNVVILNYDVSNLQELFFLIDLLNKNRIENFTYSDDPKL